MYWKVSADEKLISERIGVSKWRGYFTSREFCSFLVLINASHTGTSLLWLLISRRTGRISACFFVVAWGHKSPPSCVFPLYLTKQSFFIPPYPHLTLLSHPSQK
uniref:Uncharacterized protein n=1 Tax=Trypanosoma congolense (strain IL3000) TaxID=1068625 RepID=G0UTX6_TRYCI|nr:hypothetical protein, unlikely [Trypanosoma congolense IL3000]